jgi:hypothetical protein
MTETMVERIDQMEHRLDELAAEVRRGAKRKDWRAWVGTAKDDPDFDEMIRLGREYRESQREPDSERP